MAAGAKSRASGTRGRGKAGEPPVQVTIPARTIVLFVGIALGSLVLLAVAYAARSILWELAAAIVLAMAAEPLVRAFERRGLKRGAAVGISFGILLAALLAFGYVLLSPLVDQSTRLFHNAPQIVEDLSKGHGRLGFLETRFHIVERAKEIDAGSLGATSGPARAAVDSVVRTTGSIVFVLFLTLFVQLGGRQWWESCPSEAASGFGAPETGSRRPSAATSPGTC